MHKILINKSILLLIISFIVRLELIAQIENIKATHHIYPFLKKMQVKGILQNYDDMIIPFSREEINSFLLQIDSSRNLLSSSDREFLDRMKEKLFLINNEKINLFDGFPGDLANNITLDKKKHLYHYNDSVVTFNIDPIFEYNFLHSSHTESSASLLNYGGTMTFSFNDWLGFYVEGTNGIVWGNRNTAVIDDRVGQSFTFNDTKINYFDGTQGYLRLHKDIFNLQLGRERILWGRGYLNKMILSDNPPLFDFVKFNVSYKTLKYDFIHAWLIQPKTIVFIDSLRGESRNKPAKYLAAKQT